MKFLMIMTVSGFLGLAQCCAPDTGAQNLALNGEATQSSEISAVGAASKAIDNNRDGTFFAGSCSHTKLNNSDNAWWKLDLKQTYKIDTIIIANRQDCCKDRLKGAEVRVGNSPDNDNPVCATIDDVSNPYITVCCNGMEGQYVTILNPSSNIALALCEVEVYGDLVEKISICW